MWPLLPAAVSSEPASCSVGGPPRGQLPGLGSESPHLAASLSRPLRGPRVSGVSQHLWLPPRVPEVSIARSPVDLAMLGAMARYCARKAISERRSIDKTLNPLSFLGSRMPWMVVCSSRSCPTKKGQQSINTLVDFLCAGSPSFRRDNAAVKGQGTVVSKQEQGACIPDRLRTFV